MSQMSPEEEDAVQAELEALQREALVSYPYVFKVAFADHSACYTRCARADTSVITKCTCGGTRRVDTCHGGRR